MRCQKGEKKSSWWEKLRSCRVGNPQVTNAAEKKEVLCEERRHERNQGDFSQCNLTGEKGALNKPKENTSCGGFEDFWRRSFVIEKKECRG